MRNFDLTPLYRSAIGYDRLATMLDSANRADQSTYPPYNIEATGEHAYRITMAVAGFTREEITLTTESGNLLIQGDKSDDTDKRHYLYQGIAARNFERRFQLADHVRVVSAALEDGLLHVELIREIPEAMKSRTIDIS